MVKRKGQDGGVLHSLSGFLHADMKLCDTPAGFESAKTLKHQVKTRLGGHFKAYQSSSPGGLMTVMPPDAQQIGFIGRKYHFLWMMAREQQFTGLESVKLSQRSIVKCHLTVGATLEV